jgi:hypothetical protein
VESLESRELPATTILNPLPAPVISQFAVTQSPTPAQLAGASGSLTSAPGSNVQAPTLALVAPTVPANPLASNSLTFPTSSVQPVTSLLGPAAQVAANPTLAILPQNVYTQLFTSLGWTQQYLFVPNPAQVPVLVLPSPVPDQGHFLFGDENTLREAYISDLPPNATQGEFRISGRLSQQQPLAPPMQTVDLAIDSVPSASAQPAPAE